MKKNNLIFAGVFFLFPIFNANSQINTSIGGASNVLPNSPTSNTNVGIGTNNPTEKLEVIGAIKSKNLQANNTATGSTSFSNVLDWYKNALVLSAGYEMTDPVISGSKRRGFNFYDMNVWGDAISIDEDYWSMDVVDRNNKQRFLFEGHKSGGISNGRSTFRVNDKNETEILTLIDPGNSKIRLQMAKQDSQFMIGGFSDYAPGLSHKFVVQNGSALIEGNILTNSSIGIGTSSFTDGSDNYRLSVNGSVRANRVRVYTTWADYVFENSYKLPTLNEVEDHINKKGHLIDIPSAKEVEANGIELGEMNKLLLQKVEELTLYIIQMNKELENVKGQLKRVER